MMRTMELNRYTSIDNLAQDIYEELKDHFLRGGSFSPVLFLHDLEGDQEPALLEMISLEGEEQENWPELIRDAVERTDATLWALATQVLIRRTSVDQRVQSEDLLFVYVVADAAQPAGARIWSTRLDVEQGEFEPLKEQTEDPRLQLMIAHLTGARFLH
jgi:hypothetical protein